MIEKEKRHQLFENDDIVLEQRGNHYYLSLFDKDGKFQREVNITVKDDFKVTMYNDKSWNKWIMGKNKKNLGCDKKACL